MEREKNIMIKKKKEHFHTETLKMLVCKQELLEDPSEVSQHKKRGILSSGPLAIDLLWDFQNLAMICEGSVAEPKTLKANKAIGHNRYSCQ